MFEDADLAGVARLLGEPHRAQFMLSLLGGEELSAGELAARAGASSSLASSHLSKLLDAGLLDVRTRGRQRYYRIANAGVANAVEALLAIAPSRPVSSLSGARHGEAIRHARTCYDHLAGRLGVALTDALERTDTLRPSDSGWTLTTDGERSLQRLGIDIGQLRHGRRVLTRPCLDWTERRPHLAGALGAALATQLFELGWLRRLPRTRAVQVTPIGRQRLRARLGIQLAHD
jgi:DNA-binding transcriptional ArsR family regulator